MPAPPPPGDPSPLVYIAASARDDAAVEAVRRALTEAGISCGGARRDLPPATPFAEAVAADISASRSVVAIVSPQAVASRFVLQEVQFASEARKPIIALVIDDAVLSPELEYLLAQRLRLAAPGNLEFHLPVLVDAVRRCLAAGAAGVPPAGAPPVTSCYPAPIALAYRRYGDADDPPTRIQALFYAVEATLRYLAVLGLSDLLAGLALGGDASAAIPRSAGFDLLRREGRRTTPGQWAETLRATTRALGARPNQISKELVARCAPGSEPFEGLVSWLIRKRNDWAHPTGGPLSREECKALLDEAGPRLDELLRHVRFVCDYPLGFTTEAGEDWRLHSCMGAEVGAPVPCPQPFLRDRPKPELPFVVTPGDGWLLYLWPLLTQRSSPQTSRPALYFFEMMPPRGDHLTAIRSYAVDFREEWEQRLHPEPADSHAWLFERLRDLPALAQAPPGLGAALRTLPPAAAPVPPPTARPRPTSADEEAFSSQTVVMLYPAPVAVAYRRFCQEQGPTDRLLKLFSCVEAVTRYLVTLGVCDLFQCLAAGGKPDAALPDHKAFLFLQRPQNMQMGMWIEALRETARALAGPPGLVRELPAAAVAGGRLLAVLGELVKKRNKCVHRGVIAITAGECVKLLPALRPKLDEALRLIRFTCAYPLGFARGSLGQPGEPGRHRYYFHSCVGARVADTDNAHVAELPLALAEDVPFVVTPDGTRLLYLWPLLLQRVADLTGRHTLYTFERIPEDDWPFLTKVEASAIDVDDAWPVELAPKPSASLAWLLERLRQMPAVVELPRELELAEELQPTRRGGLVGQRLKTGLSLKSALATGGFGTVYAATDGDGRPVAVKVLEVPGARGELKRFQQEFAKLQSAGQHPGIIRCYEQGIAMIGKREYPWYSMELAVGDLSCRIDARLKRGEESLPWDDPAHRRAVLDEFQAVVEAVAHLHSLDVVHRDIKPGNVLVMEDGGLRLSDFGLVKSLNPSERSLGALPKSSAGGVKGTLIYMAPEQERGERVTKAADTYALGVLLAELATGRRPEPRTAGGPGSALQGDALLKRLPEPLRALILQCTDRDADRRPADAAAVRERLGELRRSPEGEDG